MSVRGLEQQRDHVAALAHLARYAKRAESTPRRRRAGRCTESGVSRRRAAVALLGEQRLEGTTPAGAQRRDAQRALQLIAGVTGHVKQRIDLGHAHALGPGGDLRDLVAGLDFSFLQHTEIEAGPSVLDHQRGHFRLVHADAQPVTGDTRLRHLEQGAADPVTVSDAHLCIWQAIDGEILSELPIDEVVSSQLVLPIPIGIHLIDKYRPAFAAMTGQVPLSVAVYVEPAHHARALDRRLPDAGMDRPALPGHVARQAHID